MQEILGFFSKEKVVIPQYKDTQLQVKVLYSKLYLHKNSLHQQKESYIHHTYDRIVITDALMYMV